ncbi:hypothetical protein JXB28_01965 [Candidatus Woesearchaeota archaeon]|nr:hypothetical protein [Candidatus Woesearchaeota archaeon]
MILVVLLISQSMFVAIMTYRSVDDYRKSLMPSTGKASTGVLTFCINNAPTLDISDCQQGNATQDEEYECELNASDIDYENFTYSVSFPSISRAFSNATTALFDISSDGLVSFTPDNFDVGNYTILFSVDDGVNCDNSISSEYLYFSVANVNDPPYLITDIPDQSVGEDEVIYPFYLNNYFDDPDMDPMNYSVTSTENFQIDIDSLTSSVSIRALQCDATEYVIFTAIDPYSDTGDSNLVTITCDEEEDSGDDDGEGGGGGGGGGGTSLPCKPEYECYDYFKCRKNNTKVQRCVDTNGCENDVFLTVPCKYVEEIVCNESWNCTEWGPCLPNGTQYRTCEDMNGCGTEEYKPLTSQECIYIGTCDDSIQNCHDGACEEGIDCGGPCPACKSIQTPYPFEEEEKGILIYIITGIILLLLTAILLYHYFHKEINAALAKAGWIISRRKKKQLLLSVEDKRKLLADIKELEGKLDKIELHHAIDKYAVLIRFYMTNLTTNKGLLIPEFNTDELKKVLEQKKATIREVLRRIFISMFTHYIKVEGDKSLITRTNIVLMLEELRNIALQTSKVEDEDLARELKELPMPDKASSTDKILTHITNTYIALEYLELDVAKKKYLSMLSEYEKLKVKEQEDVFESLSRLYHNISYVNSWLEKPIVVIAEN